MKYNKPIYILYNDYWGYCEFDSTDCIRTAIRVFVTYSECVERSRVIHMNYTEFYVSCDDKGLVKSFIFTNELSQNFEFEIVDIYYESWLNV